MAEQGSKEVVGMKIGAALATAGILILSVYSTVIAYHAAKKAKSHNVTPHGMMVLSGLGWCAALGLWVTAGVAEPVRLEVAPLTILGAVVIVSFLITGMCLEIARGLR